MAPLFSLAGFGGGIASKLLGGSSPFATGGTELEPGDGFKYHVFLSPGDFVVNAEGGEVTYLIVGGGGGSGGSGKLNPPNIPSSTQPFAPNYKGYSGGGGVACLFGPGNPGTYGSNANSVPNAYSGLGARGGAGGGAVGPGGEESSPSRQGAASRPARPEPLRARARLPEHSRGVLQASGGGLVRLCLFDHGGSRR